MSYAAADWAIKAPIDNIHRKMVLIAIAQHANDDDEAWPSIRRIAKLSAVSDRGARYAIADLIKAGYLRLSGDTNHRRYHLIRHQRAVARETQAPNAEGIEDAAPAPVADPSASPADPSGTGCRRISKESIINPSGDADASAAHGKQAQGEDKQGDGGTLPPKPAKPDAKPKRKRGRGKRLHEDWQPSADDIKLAEQHPTVDWRTEALRFRNYWLAKSGKDAAKQDWPRTWENWIINEARYARERAQRRGNGGAGRSTNAAPVMPPEELWAVRLADFQTSGFWLRAWGPKPGEEGCRASDRR